MRNDTTVFGRFRLEIIALFIVCLIILVTVLKYYPIVVTTENDVGKAIMPQQLGQSDVLLILPDRVENAQSYPQMDFSFAWYNMLSQSVGPITISLVKNIQAPADIQQFRVIIVPESSAVTMTSEQITLVSQAVQLGASLVIEMPSPEWASLTSINRHPKVSSSIKHFTDAPNTPLTGNWKDQLLNTPLDTQVMRIDALDADTPSADSFLLELDGAMAHYRRTVGTGSVFVLTFNLGQALTSLQQGRPTDSFTLNTQDPSPKTSHLISNEKMASNTIPFADLLKNHVIGSLVYAAPMPLLWPFAEASRSALIVTHQTGSMDDRIFQVAQYERKREVTSTYLATAEKISPLTLEDWKNKRFDIGVTLYQPPSPHVYRKFGPSFLQPIVFETSLLQQRKSVGKSANMAISTCKFADSLWSVDYTYPFRKLAAAQCKIDMSYAPTEPQQYGYLFGSGFPFLPIERNGLPMPTYEFPVVINDESGLDTIPKDAAVNLLKESESTYHEPIVANFNADTMIHYPSQASVATWLSLINYALENSTWITTVQSFMVHYTLRKQAHLHYAFHQQTKMLDVQAMLPKADFNYTMALPRRTAFGAIHALWVDKTSVDITAVKTTGDGLLALIPIPSGDHLVQVQFQ